MICNSCGSQTASDVTGTAYCCSCGEKCIEVPDRSFQLEMEIAKYCQSIQDDTAEYKPLLAEELSQ